MAQKHFPPYVVGSHFRALHEDFTHTSVSGDLDPRKGPDEFRPVDGQTGKYGTLSMSASGEWTYVIDNTLDATQALSNGDRMHDWFFVYTADGGGRQVISVTIHGSNEGNSVTADTDIVSLVGVAG